MGESLANKSPVPTAVSSSSSSIRSTSLPKNRGAVFTPTLPQTFTATPSLSPVRTTVRTPCSMRAAMAARALSLGGSKKPTKPMRTMSFSSATLKVSLSGTSFFWATASIRSPSVLYLL